MVDEKQEAEAKESSTEEKSGDNAEGIQQTADNLIEQTNKAAERAELAIARMEKESLRLAELQAKSRLAGKSEAGTSEPEKKEESPADYAKRISQGKVE